MQAALVLARDDITECVEDFGIVTLVRIGLHGGDETIHQRETLRLLERSRQAFRSSHRHHRQSVLIGLFAFQQLTPRLC